MRVITGVARGRVLKALAGETTRPTTDKVKEAVFSAIQFDLEGRRVLDLFAGSGQLGIEALSRGAEHAVFVDSDRQAVAVVNQNLQITDLTRQATVVCRKAQDFIGTTDQIFDVVFLDPPYGLNLLPDLLPRLLPCLSDYAILVCEHAYDCPLPPVVGHWSAGKTKKYGTIGVTIYRKTK